MRGIVLGLVLMAGPAAAQDGWRVLPGDEIAGAVTARVLGYPGGMIQDFFADGTTLTGKVWGRWEVVDGRLCTAIPPATLETCHQVERGLRKPELRFTDETGAAVVGRYIDLN